MDPVSEALMRSCIHDMANTLSGIQGILELSDPSAPISGRDRSRLESILMEGTCTLERARHLAMETLPEAAAERGSDWRKHLETLLSPLSIIFRCAIEIRYEGNPADDEWPGALGLGFAQALTRQALPYARAGAMNLICSADSQEWRIRWTPVSDFPRGILSGQTSSSRDIAMHWFLRTGTALGAHVNSDEDGLLAIIPRR